MEFHIDSQAQLVYSKLTYRTKTRIYHRVHNLVHERRECHHNWAPSPTHENIKFHFSLMIYDMRKHVQHNQGNKRLGLPTPNPKPTDDGWGPTQGP